MARRTCSCGRPPNWAMIATDKMTLKTKSKLLTQTNGPYQLLTDKYEIVAIEKNGIPNTISYYHVPPPPQHLLRLHVRIQYCGN